MKNPAALIPVLMICFLSGLFGQQLISIDGPRRSFEYRDIEVSGDLVFLLGVNSSLLELQVFDRAALALGNKKTGCPTIGNFVLEKHVASRMAAGAGRVYIAAGEKGIVVLDVANLKAITLVGILPVTTSATDVLVDGNTLFVGGKKSFSTYAIGDSGLPVLLGTLEMPGTAYGMCKQGSRVFVAAGPVELPVFDVSSPSAPVLEYTVRAKGSPFGVAVKDDYLYISDDFRGIQVAKLIGGRPVAVDALPGNNLGGPLLVSGNKLIAASLTGRGIAVFSLDNPEAPKLVHFQDYKAWYNLRAWGMAVDGERIYLATQELSVALADASGKGGSVKAYKVFNRAKAKTDDARSRLYFYSSLAITNIDGAATAIKSKSDETMLETNLLFLDPGSHEFSVEIYNNDDQKTGTLEKIKGEFLAGEEYVLYQQGNYVKMVSMSLILK